MFCCDPEDTLASQCSSTVFLHRPPSIKPKKHKGINLIHKQQKSKPVFTLKSNCKSQLLLKPRMSLTTQIGFEHKSKKVDRCITEIQFYQESNRSLKNINSSRKVLKPYIPVALKSERLLLFSKQTQTTQTHDYKTRQSNRYTSRQIIDDRFRLKSDLLPATSKIMTVESSKFELSDCLMKAKRCHQIFNPEEDIHFRHGIQNLKGLKLADSQVLIMKTEEEPIEQINQQGSQTDRVRVTLQQSIVEQYSILNSFKLIKSRSKNQYIAVERQIGMIVSLKIMDITNMQSISGQITISKMLSNSDVVLKVYHSVVNKNKQYVLVREYYESYLKHLKIKEPNIVEKIIQVLNIIEQMVSKRVLHSDFYNNLVMVNGNIKLANLEYSQSESNGFVKMNQYYSNVANESVLRLMNQIKYNSFHQPSPIIKRIQEIINKKLSYERLRMEIIKLI